MAELELFTFVAQTVIDGVEVPPFDRPDIDWHAVAPELVLLAVGSLLTLFDLVFLERGRRYTAALTGVGLLLAMIPIVTLALHDTDVRTLFYDGYVVDDFSLILKAMFILVGYVVVLLSTNYMAEGDYWESEYYSMLMASILGMVVMSSARDLITIFVALELLSIPAYLMSTWRKRDLKSNEAGIKYYLMGVFASAIMLYGMSLIFGVTGTTVLSEINTSLSGSDGDTAIVTMGIVFVIIGFGFKVSAFPFQSWAPDTYEGAPTPVTAFLAVASKAAGFVALMQLIIFGFLGRSDVFQPLIWVLAVGSMIAGNVMALRQTNLIRLMAYSGVAQAGFMLAPLAVAGEGIADDAMTAVVTYLVIYAAMNLGAFAVIIAVARKTGSGELESYNGLFSYAPGLAVVMTIFLASLAGIPPLGGWFAKFQVFTVLAQADTWAGYLLMIIAAVNTVIAFGYYGKLAMRLWAEDAWEGDESPIRVPAALVSALGITAGLTIAFGVVPGIVTHLTEVSLALPN